MMQFDPELSSRALSDACFNFMRSEQLKEVNPELYKQIFGDDYSRMRAIRKAKMEEETKAQGVTPSPPEVDPSIPPPAKSLDAMSDDEKKARIEELEKHLAKSNEMLAQVTKSGTGDITLNINNAASKQGAMGQVDPLAEMANKDRIRRQNTLIRAMQLRRNR